MIKKQFLVCFILFLSLSFRWPIDQFVESYETLELEVPSGGEFTLRGSLPVFTLRQGIPLPQGEIKIFDYGRDFWGGLIYGPPFRHRLFDRVGLSQISHHTIMPHRGDGTRPRLMDLRYEHSNTSVSLVTWRNNIISRNEGVLRLIITDNSLNEQGTGIESITIGLGGQQFVKFYPGILKEMDGRLTRQMEPQMEYSFQEIRFSAVPAIQVILPFTFAETRSLLSIQVVDFEGNINSLQFVVILQESP